MGNPDLNLFAVFDALERERSVTRAADALGLSQPAVSHALKRLRDRLKDPLFIRTASGMEPTPRARELAAPIREAVAQLQATLVSDRFEPVTSCDRFSIVMNNFATIVFAAPLAACIARNAPRIGLIIKPSGTLDLELLLNRGEIDLAIGTMAALSPNDPRRLLDDRYVAVMRPSHPNGNGPLDLESFARAGHVKISSLTEDTGFVDMELGRLGRTRTIQLEAPYIASGAILAGSDLVGVVAHRIALELCRTHGLIWRELPIAAPPITIGMMWPPIYERKPSHRWLRATIKALATAPRSIRS